MYYHMVTPILRLIVALNVCLLTNLHTGIAFWISLLYIYICIRWVCEYAVNITYM